MQHIDFQVLRDKHPRFSYQRVDVTVQEDGVTFSYEFVLENGPTFKPSLFFPLVSAKRIESFQAGFLQELAFQVGMVELLSYWKSACSPHITIEAGYLNAEQMVFWKQLLEKGLSEFFFVNQIDGWHKDFLDIEVTHLPVKHDWQAISLSQQVLIPVGGGKDSAVSLELAKELPFPVTSLTLNSNDQIRQLLTVSGISDNRNVQRFIDPQLIELNRSGYLNGHTPFSALLAFVSATAAILYDYKYIALSNEWSANEGNTVFLGQTINHQYSKTFEFEEAFDSYFQKYLIAEVQYFSWLRPLHEIQIAELFSRVPQYFPIFLSCNRGQKSGKWCGECPKCMFVFILLSAFLDQFEVQAIWGQDLFAKPNLKPILQELTGQIEVKSLECVGTRQESIYALALALERNEDAQMSLLWKTAKEIVGDVKQTADDARQFLKGYQNDSHLPTEFKSILKAALGIYE